MPTSIIPDWISWAICTTAMSPDEHCLLSVLSPAVYGIPAIRDAARATFAPPPGVRTVPTATSSINAGFIPDVLTTPWPSTRA